MSAKPNGIFSWDITEIAKSLKITESDVKLYFKDGRRVSFILERRIAYEFMKAKLSPSEGAGYDIIASDGGKWEVRSITRSGVYFCPSYMVGSGRSFNERGFLVKMKEIEGYILTDVESFPDIPFWIFKKDIIQEWWEKGWLGKTTKISRERALGLINSVSK